jgi:hypothetical protein
MCGAVFVYLGGKKLLKALTSASSQPSLLLPQHLGVKLRPAVGEDGDFGADGVYQGRVNRSDEELGGFVPLDDGFTPGVNDAGVAEEVAVFGCAHPVAGDHKHLIFDSAAAYQRLPIYQPVDSTLNIKRLGDASQH